MQAVFEPAFFMSFELKVVDLAAINRIASHRQRRGRHFVLRLLETVLSTCKGFGRRALMRKFTEDSWLFPFEARFGGDDVDNM